MTLDIDILNELLVADFESGKLFWRERDLKWFSHCKNPIKQCGAWNARFSGKEAFTAYDTYGYRHGDILNKKYRTHRVIFAMFYEKWPEKVIDHINGDRGDNNISNLREASSQQNSFNMKKNKRNTSTYKGVSWNKSRNKWEAQIRLGDSNKFLGYHINLEDAAAAYVNAAKKLHGEFYKHDEQ